MPAARHCFVVPAYGRSPHLRECLQSLRAQTLPSPVIVTSSTPYEGLEALAGEFDARLVVHGHGNGIGRDWNFALSQATAPWATIAHQDDVYLPMFVERTLALLDRVPQATLLLTGYAEMLDGEVRDPGTMLLVKRVLLELGFLGRRAVSSRSSKRRLLRFGCPIPCPSVTLNLARTQLRFREDLKVDLDWEAWLRLAAMDGSFAYDRCRLMLHRIHAGSETSAGVRGGARAREDLMMFESLWPRPVARMLAKVYALAYDTGGGP